MRRKGKSMRAGVVFVSTLPSLLSLTLTATAAPTTRPGYAANAPALSLWARPSAKPAAPTAAAATATAAASTAAVGRGAPAARGMEAAHTVRRPASRAC